MSLKVSLEDRVLLQGKGGRSGVAEVKTETGATAELTENKNQCAAYSNNPCITPKLPSLSLITGAALTDNS